MSQRLDFYTAAPDGMKAFGGVHRYINDCGLPKQLVNLVYLRVSQINGCAYCTDMHSRDLLKDGMPIEKLVLIPVWRESGELFSAKEKAAMAWAEAVTLVAATHVPDEAFTDVKAQFSDKELADLTIAIGLMNAFNRLGISFRKPPAAAAHPQK